MIRAGDIHRRVGPAWPQVLARLGIAEQYLRMRAVGGRHRGVPGPCPACGGRDRYFFDNRHQRGDWHCRHCGAGSGFDLLMRVHGWDFRETRARVIAAVGLQDGDDLHGAAVVHQPPPAEIAAPTPRVWRLLRESCELADCADAVAYLEHRQLWPLPATALRAHPCAEYFADGQLIGRYPALVSPVTDLDGELISAHLTYIEDGHKLAGHEPRKLLSPLTGRIGCAVRLMPATDTLGIAEGLETALAAAKIHDVPVWSALCASLLAKFEPPAGIKRVLIFADRDIAGLEAAARLGERLQGRIAFEIRAPTAPAKDWADSLSEETTT